jgi:hypothetical protein
MIVQLVEIAVGGLVSICGMGLGFVFLWDGRRMSEMKREVRAIEEEEAQEKNLIHFAEDSIIEPHAEYFLGGSCPKCNDITKPRDGDRLARGIAYRAISCRIRGSIYRCEVKKTHMHLRCESCNLHWIIAPKDAKIVAPKDGESHAERTV